jgi:hypothetical protein
MKGVDTIARVRREHLVRGKTIKEIARDLHLSRNTVRKILRSGATTFEYERRVQPQPKLGLWRGELDRLLAANAARPNRERLTLMRLFEELGGLGYGKDRAYNRRFVQMCGHYLVEPVACTPGAAWEKGQIENQVGVSRQRLFTPRLRFRSYDELNAWLLDRCVAMAKVQAHPEVRDRTIWEMFEVERASLIPYAGPFDGFHAIPATVSKTCLVRFDNNKYSVSASAVGRPVEIRAYADRVELRQDGRVVGEHRRVFGRGQTVYDPWHYVPVLARKPGALRNGAPFKNWVLPGALERVRRKLAKAPGGDRQMVAILSAVLTDGLAAVEAACAEALAEGVHSADVVLNILARRREPGPPLTITTPDALRLRLEPAADCIRYDSLRRAI